MSDVEQAVVRLRDIVSRFESVMNETNAVSAEESIGDGYPFGSGSSKGVEGQALDELDLLVAEDDLGVLFALVRRGREGYEFEAVKPEIKRTRPPYNPGGWL
ncbi:hypothetical protein CORC01_09851 [Colletotrichum orchidophilum]|uniref:Uncharacterized protein n=1 Tax=Colletotrichum orchidophilum TaxID=1209926 RepID=A0A1G4B0H4_9PEZI|nr:uncharacterized protein CORC01_09851 [Colletotrichum orchidophilum]OHE94833.1 hypothetical protein CORC01_09851 [Colletotrichum orchidophilum]